MSERVKTVKDLFVKKLGVSPAQIIIKQGKANEAVSADAVMKNAKK